MYVVCLYKTCHQEGDNDMYVVCLYSIYHQEGDNDICMLCAYIACVIRKEILILWVI